MRRQAQLLINQFNNLNINTHVLMSDPINYVFSPFEGNLNPEDPMGIKLYLQAAKEIDK